ncbi:MAG: (4Fe-4S)-binding protein [Deltaproteobacteria bacterium]|nr:MAG: (4Fe-4S)-binding protein [Deltaproteobacteria bacterium]
MIISIASGKGGTGKTTIATNLAASLDSGTQILDCDVEEPNAHLFLNPLLDKTEIITIPVPEVNKDKCSLCGKCAEICQFKAITVIAKTVLTFHELCHSCGGCMEVCPEDAITEVGRELGTLQTGHRDNLKFADGKLKVGEAMAPPLIKKVRSCADPDRTIIIDAPPGTSCPVITAMDNTDFVLLVTEPTPFGLHDLKLAVGAVKILGIPAGLVINRSDMGDDKVHEYAESAGLPILMEIPFDRKIAEAYSRGQLLVDAMPEFKENFIKLYKRIAQIVNA